MVSRATHSSLEDAGPGEPGLGRPSHGTPDRSVRGPPRAACRRHHFVPAPLACRGGRRRARRGGARASSCSCATRPATPIAGRPPCRSWCRHRDDKGELPEGVPPMLLQGQSAVALGGDVTGARSASSRARRGRPDDVTFDFATNERGDIFTLTRDGADRASRRRTLADSYASAYLGARRQAVAAGSRGAARQRPARRSPRSRIASPRWRPSWDGSTRTCWPACPTRPSPGRPRQRPTGRRAAITVRRPPGVDPDRDPAAGVRAAGPAPADRGGQADLRAEQHRRHRAAGRTPPSSSEWHPRTSRPEPPTPLIPIGVAVGVAALLALGVPVLLDRIDHSIRDSHTAGDALAAPVLSTIPPPASPANLATLARPESARGHAFRTLATASVATDQLPPRHRRHGPGRHDAGQRGGQLRRRPRRPRPAGRARAHASSPGLVRRRPRRAR